MTDGQEPVSPGKETYTAPMMGAPELLRRPFRRLLLLCAVLLTLPFTWGERGGCTSTGPVPYTGLDFITSEDAGPVLAVLVLLPVALGVLAVFLSSAGRRLACELVATIAATLGAALAAVNALVHLVFSKGGPYPAPFIAALAVFGIAIDVVMSAAKELHAVLAARRGQRAKDAPPPP